MAADEEKEASGPSRRAALSRRRTFRFAIRHSYSEWNCHKTKGRFDGHKTAALSLCFPRKSSRYAALGMGCTITAVSRSTQRSTLRGTVNEYQPYGDDNTWRSPMFGIWQLTGGLKGQVCCLAYNFAATWHWPTVVQMIQSELLHMAGDVQTAL